MDRERVEQIGFVFYSNTWVMGHYKVDSLLNGKDRWRAPKYRLILGSPISRARDATSPLPCVTVVSQSHPLCSSIIPHPLLRSLHASPSYPFSLILVSLLLLASINSPLPLLPVILLTAFSLLRWPLSLWFPLHSSPSVSLMSLRNGSTPSQSKGGA